MWSGSDYRSAPETSSQQNERELVAAVDVSANLLQIFNLLRKCYCTEFPAALPAAPEIESDHHQSPGRQFSGKSADFSAVLFGPPETMADRHSAPGSGLRGEDQGGYRLVIIYGNKDFLHCLSLLHGFFGFVLFLGLMLHPVVAQVTDKGGYWFFLSHQLFIVFVGFVHSVGFAAHQTTS
jgi:hypothetical protein